MSARERLSRRTFLSASATVAALAAVERSGAANDGARSRPNILWLVSEDNNPFIGAYGDRLAHTPAIDALAKQGVLYANAFSNSPVCAPTRFGIITGMYAESCGPAHHMRAEGRVPAFLQGFPKYLRDVGYYCTNNVKTDYNAALDMQAMWDRSSADAHWRDRPKDAPFFAVFNFMTTHESKMFKQMPGKVRPQDVRVPAYLPDTPEVRQDFASYYTLMEQMDGEVTAHLAALESSGLAEDTIVIYYSDNGGVMPRSKRYCYDEGLRVGLIARFPPKWAHLAPAAAGSTISTPVSLIDLAPTVLTLAGIDPPAHMQGVSLVRAKGQRSHYVFGMRNRMDERYDMIRTVRDERYRYIRNYAPHRPYGQHQAFEWQMESYRAWQSAHLAGRLNAVQERFFAEKPAEEFYDLRDDPDQIENLIDAPAHRERIAAMRVALDAHMLEINDNGFIPESSPLEGYDASRAPGAYPLKRVMQVADSAIRRDPGQAAQFARLLADPNEVIRYWAAQGLLMLKERAAIAKPVLEACLEKDSSPQVRIVAAEALTKLGVPDRSVRYLGEVLSAHPDARVRLQSLNALTFIGEPARAVLLIIERAIESAGDEYIRSAARYLSFTLRGTYTPSSPVYQGRGART
ncbi:MAG TPA: sulfatase-like hydrolase/transferase [Steroidobacter sp.]